MEFVIIFLLVAIGVGAFFLRRGLSEPQDDRTTNRGGSRPTSVPHRRVSPASSPPDIRKAGGPAGMEAAPGRGAVTPGGFGPANELETVLQEAAQGFAVRAAAGENWEEILEEWSPQVSEAAAKLHGQEGREAVGTARKFFEAHVAMNLQGYPQMRGDVAMTVLARTEHWVVRVLDPYLEDPETRHFDLGSDDHGDDPNSLARQIWRAAGLNVAIHGPGPADELVDVLRHRAPELCGHPTGPFLQHAEPNLRIWIVLLEGPAGSCCVISEATLERDGSFDAQRLSPGILPVAMLNSPPPTRDGQGVWKTTMFSNGLTDCEELADRVLEGRLLQPIQCGSLVRT